MKNISQAHIRSLRVPEIPLTQQQSIVAAHTAFARRIGALEGVLGKLGVAEEAIVSRVMTDAVDRIPLGKWLDRIEAGKSPLAEDTPAGDAEWGVLKVSAVQAGWFKSMENKTVRDPALINPQYEVRHGDLIMTRANTEQLVGLACIARNPEPRLMLSDKTLRLVPDEAVGDSGFIELVLLSAGVRRQVKARATGTSGSMKNIGQAAIRQLLVPDVPTEEQRQIVAAVEASRRRVENLRGKIAKLRTVQQGLVEDLLSGKVCVPAT
ncbi:EcoKI restriction-modification system protein HsdS [Streptomyces sp. S4.7]|nr:EcoKI restriction-modification system protein HsdS [Streptomyces sp. S4.7]